MAIARIDSCVCYFFFFSSRRRHTRSDRDWSSDVCSSDLFSLVATQRVGRRVLINFDFAASSDYIAPIFNPVTFASRGYRFRGMAKADLGGSYTLPLGGEARSLRFFGYVDNLFDREYFESGFRTPGRTGRAGASFIF